MRPDDEFDSGLLISLCSFSLLCGLALCLLVLTAEFLHSVTHGRVPRLIDWQPSSARAQQHNVDEREAEDDGEGDEEEEIEEIITSAPPQHP